jgi:hypothetical protein
MATDLELANASMVKTQGVYADLVRVIRHAITIDACFVVGEGVRNDADQLRDWQRGVSKLNGIPVGQVVNGVHGTGRGNHQVNLTDGFGHACDLPPLINHLVWGGPHSSGNDQWEGCYRTAAAVRTAAIAENVRIRWGGQWDIALNDLADGAAALKKAHNDYMAQFHATHGRWPLADGPHFELKAP